MLCAAGALGAIGSTVAAGVAALNLKPTVFGQSLITCPGVGNRLLSHRADFPPLEKTWYSGWDVRNSSLSSALRTNRTVQLETERYLAAELNRMEVFEAPDPQETLGSQVNAIEKDLVQLKGRYPGLSPVLVNLLPASGADPPDVTSLDQLMRVRGADYADWAYFVAALQTQTPFVNFTSNPVEMQFLAELAESEGVPVCGRDGKTGQTFFKILIASGLASRRITIDGWYSLNILGNADGSNLSNESRARHKLSNKTDLLEKALGYPVGEQYGESTHKVRIDYYPPRGDSKEAWDVVDLVGFLGEPMSLRINLQGKDSVLAAPIVIDLGRILAALKRRGRGGLISELSFFFKRPMGEHPSFTYEDQLRDLKGLLASIEEAN